MFGFKNSPLSIPIRAILIFFLLSFSNCRNDKSGIPVTPIIPTPIATIHNAGASCTRAWITINLENMTYPVTLNLFRNGVTVKEINNHFKPQFTYVEQNLQPGNDYTYKALVFKPGSSAPGISSNEIIVSTMDTTSDYVELKYLTLAFPPSLDEVSIVNDKNIWATSRYGPTLHWNGFDWEQREILFPAECGSDSLSYESTNQIFTFSDGVSWISSSRNKIAVIKDDEQIDQFCIPFLYNVGVIWGISTNDVYIAGWGNSMGTIIHYNGSSWSVIISGINSALSSMSGTSDGRVIWVSGHSDYGSMNTALIKILDGKATKLFEGSPSLFIHNKPVGDISSVYTPDGFTVYYLSTNEDVWRPEINIHHISDTLLNPITLAVINHQIMSSIKGIGHNRIYITGYGGIGYYNGKSYKVLFDASVFFNYSSIDVSGSTLAAVGFYYGTHTRDYAFITMGRINPDFHTLTGGWR